MSLKIYRQKRDFKKTPEPAGKKTTTPKIKKTKRLYIIQKHAASHLHYDFRLELDGVLKSWAVPKGPSLDPNVKRLAMHVEDHPLEYGRFQGIIPKGQYGGGTVMLWDEGTWEPEDDHPMAAYKKGHLSFVLKGEKLQGRFSLVRLKQNPKSWLLIKSKDEYAEPQSKFDVTVKEPNSVTTGETMAQIAENFTDVWDENGLRKVTDKPKKKSKKRATKIKIKLALQHSAFPKKMSPQLATLVNEPPAGDNWLHEIKFDGYRLLAFKHHGKTTLFTRHQHDWTNKFARIVHAFADWPIDNVIVDGEVVVLDEKQHSDFQLLQNSIKENKNARFIFYVFDLLYYDQYDLTSLPLIERKNLLKELFISNESHVIFYSDHLVGDGKKILREVCDLGLEGMISKDAASPYLQKRAQSWLKSKCIKRQEFVIAGFTAPQGSRQYFGSLLLGTYDRHHNLIYHGNVGTGFTESSLCHIYSQLKKEITSTKPFADRIPGASKVTWVKPKLVAEIEFTEWTKENILRHPSFKGLRTDKPAAQITKEQAMPSKKIAKNKPKQQSKRASYQLTNPDKVLYPGSDITKAQIAAYYEEIQDWILPYIVERPLTLVRCPHGFTDCFYQKHFAHTMPHALHGVMIKEKIKKQKYIYIKDVNGLMALPQLAVLEIHPWGSTIHDVEHPDMIIFDLDPATDVQWKTIVHAAFELKKQLAAFKLKSFVKTTGGKGLHVVVPIKPEYTWDEVKTFAHTFVEYIVMQNPNDYVSKMTKSARHGKIFIDYLRNARGATAIAPYSTRAREHAPVAVPLHWDELSNHHEDNFFTIATTPERLANLKQDPWKNFFTITQSLRLKDFST